MMRILVVDDENDIREITAELLRLRGYEVQTVANAQGVVAAIRAFQPDLLLQDCHMPGLDLAALIQSVRAEAPSVAILLFTASIEAEGFWRSIGADGILRKPFEADDLESEIRRLLSGPRTRRAPAGRAGPVAKPPVESFKQLP